MAAARAIAKIVQDAELREDYIIPSVFNRDVAPAVADAVSDEARSSGMATTDHNTIGFAAIDEQRIRPSTRLTDARSDHRRDRSHRHPASPRP